VKIESGPHTVEMTRRMTDIGIPVMAHLGLTPQHVNRLGGYTRQGTDQAAAEEIIDLAGEHVEAGAFALVLEHVPANLAGAVTEALEIPTIGIGAGSDCDGQVLVINDVVGLGSGRHPLPGSSATCAARCSTPSRRTRRRCDGRRVPGRGTLARRGGPRRPVLIGILVEIHSFETTGAAQTLGRGRVPDRSGQYGHGDDRCRE